MTRDAAGWVAVVVVALATVAGAVPAAGLYGTAPRPADGATVAPGLLAVAVEPGHNPVRMRGVESARRAFPRATAPDLSRWWWAEVVPGTEEEVAVRLRGEDAVVHTERVRRRRPASGDEDSGGRVVSGEWHLEQLRLPAAWRHEDGDGARLGVIDTGFDADHPDLDLRDLLGRPGVSRYGEGCPEGLAGARHGTAVAGAAAGEARVSGGVVGAGPAVTTVAAALGVPAGGRCLVSGRWPRALVDMVDTGVDVVNLSFVGTRPSRYERDALRHAAARDVTVIAAAGNAGDRLPSYPAAYPEVTAVTATDEAGVRWSRASHGPWVDLSAPGVDIRTTCNGGAICPATGTSLAAAVTSGTAALLAAHDHLRRHVSVHARLLDGARAGRGGPPHLDAGRLFDDPVVRLAGATRYDTGAAIAREASVWSPDTVVLVPGDTDPGWAYALPALGLAHDPGTLVALSPRDRLARGTEEVLDRLPDDGEVVLVGGPEVGVTRRVEERLRRRFDVRRVAGDGAAGTAAAVAEAGTDGPPEAVLVARTGVFADALALSSVAAAKGHPLLLVTRGAVPAATCDWLGRHASVATIYIAGGTAAISERVADRLQRCTGPPLLWRPEIVRHAGADRIATAAAVADHHFAWPGSGPVAVAAGWTWPDAVTGGMLASRRGAPVLLSRPDALPPAVRRRLPEGGPVLLLGGRRALTAAVERSAVAASS